MKNPVCRFIALWRILKIKAFKKHERARVSVRDILHVISIM